MAFQQIETGYKPEFALGALYQGYNAGNAMNENALSQLKAEEALQKSRLTDPNDVLRSMFEGQVDAAKLNDPEFIQKQLAGYKGQMNTQIAAGDKAKALSADDIKASRRDLQNKYMTGELDARTYAQQSKMFDQIEAGTYQGNQQQQSPAQTGSGQIGFTFPPAISGAQGNEGRVTRGDMTIPQSPITDQMLDNLEGVESSHGKNTYNAQSGATGNYQFLPSTVEMLRKQGINFDPNDPLQARQAAKLYLEQLVKQNGGDVRRALAAYGGFVNKDPTDYINKVMGNTGSASLTSRFSQGSQPTPFTNLIPQSGALAQMAGVRALSPELVGKMAQGEQKNNYAESLLTTKLASAENIARAKAQFQQSPKTAEAVMAQILDKQRRGLPLSSEDVEVFNTASEVLQAKVPVNVNTQMNPNVAPNVFKGGEVRPSMPQIGQPEPQQQQKQETQKKPTKPLSEF